MFNRRKPRPSAEFERTILPHLPGAYNLARWMLGSGSDAEDVVQESCVKAFQHFDEFRGENAKAWLLAIVRNSAQSLLRKRSIREPALSLDDHFDDTRSTDPGPEKRLLIDSDIDAVRAAIEQLPAQFREVIVLCDLEDLSYREIADLTSVPIGTVMSRLNRARKQLRAKLSEHIGTEGDRHDL